jgi:hypothetical protein
MRQARWGSYFESIPDLKARQQALDVSPREAKKLAVYRVEKLDD